MEYRPLVLVAWPETHPLSSPASQGTTLATSSVVCPSDSLSVSASSVSHNVLGDVVEHLALYGWLVDFGSALISAARLSASCELFSSEA